MFMIEKINSAYVLKSAQNEMTFFEVLIHAELNL